MDLCAQLCSQQSQFVLHHHVWLTHHFTVGWIYKGKRQKHSISHGFTSSHISLKVEKGRTRFPPLRTSSNPMDSSLFRSVSRAKFELCRNGRRWIWREETVGVRTEKEKNKTKHENTWKRTAATCRAALYSICSFRGAWRPWMFLSVEKFILSWFNWNCSWRNRKQWDTHRNVFLLLALCVYCD